MQVSAPSVNDFAKWLHAPRLHQMDTLRASSHQLHLYTNDLWHLMPLSAVQNPVACRHAVISSLDRSKRQHSYTGVSLLPARHL